MKSIIKKALQSLMIVPALVLTVGVLAPVSVSAATCNKDDLTLQGGASCAAGTGAEDDLFGSKGIFKTITNILLFIIGAISVIMLIIGGIRYVVSGGDQNAVQGAKNTILYAIVGIVVAFLAYAVVNFVLSSLVKGS
jgi:hypothetical protein